MGGSSYAYDGAGNRISQTDGVDVTQYLLDLQPGLATVLQATQASDTTRYLHAPRGIHAQQDASDNWTWMLQDGLGSVRSVVDDSLSVLESRLYEPYGVPFGASGTSQTVYGFTGEPVDGNELVYLRARYYAPNLGVFMGLDPFEGMSQRPMSLNGYSWVEGNVINRVDRTGKWGERPEMFSSCSGQTNSVCPPGWIEERNVNMGIIITTEQTQCRYPGSIFSTAPWNAWQEYARQEPDRRALALKGTSKSIVCLST